MLLPFLKGFVDFRLAPVTWLVLGINFLVYFALAPVSAGPEQEIQSIFQDEYYLKNQGSLYADFVSRNSSHYGEVHRFLAGETLGGDQDRASLLGGLAVRDIFFLEVFPTASPNGDEVGFKHWESQQKKLRWAQEAHPSYQMGLSLASPQPFRWLTYIFVHSGSFHLLGNMIFLLFFGAAIEMSMGGLFFLLIFLGGGLVAAGTFLFFSDHSTTPVVGASGAVSALMAAFCVLYWRVPVRHVFFLGPQRDYMGFIFLPAWFSFITLVSGDVSGFLSSLPEFGGIAYSAHIGGWIYGGLTALALSLYSRISGKNLMENEPQRPPVGFKISLYPRVIWPR